MAEVLIGSDTAYLSIAIVAIVVTASVWLAVRLTSTNNRIQTLERHQSQVNGDIRTLRDGLRRVDRNVMRICIALDVEYDDGDG